jgi:Transposase
MAMLADSVEVVIGVDTHKDTHTAAVLAAATGQTMVTMTVAATPGGYQQLLELAGRQPSRRIWAIESTGGYGAGLTRFLHAHQEQVAELDRPKRAARRHGAKSDPLDATRAAREALGRDQLAQPEPPDPAPRCRCGWPPAAPRSKPPGMPNANSMPWSLRHQMSCGNGSGLAPPASWWLPVPGCGSTPTGMWRQLPPQPPCGAWPVGSVS